MEVYVTRGTDTEVRAYEGEVESLTSADSSGVGIRVLVDEPGGAGSQVGFAWAGSLDPDVIAATLADARDNARFATPDPDVVLAEPDGVAAVELDLWDDGVAATPDGEEGRPWRSSSSGPTRPADPRVRQVSSADYSDSRVEVALVSTTGISSYRRAHERLPLRRRHRRRGRGHPDRRRVQRRARARASWCPTRRWTTPCCGPRGCSARRRRARPAARSSSTRGSSRRCSASSRRRSPVRRWSRDAPSSPGASARRWRLRRSPWSTTRPTPAPTAPPSHDGEGLACRRNVLISDGILRMFVFDTVSARRAGTASTGSAVRGGFAGTPSAGCRALVLDARGPGPGRDPRRRRRGALRAVGHRRPLGGEPGERGLLGRGGGADDPGRRRWPSRCARSTVASTLQRMLQSVVEIGADLRWLPGVAAGQTLAIADMTLSGD